MLHAIAFMLIKQNAFFPGKWPLSPFLNVSVCPDIYFAQITTLNFHWHYLLNTIRSKITNIILIPLLQADNIGRGRADNFRLSDLCFHHMKCPVWLSAGPVGSIHVKQVLSISKDEDLAFAFNWMFLLLGAGTPWTGRSLRVTCTFWNLYLQGPSQAHIYHFSRCLCLNL